MASRNSETLSTKQLVIINRSGDIIKSAFSFDKPSDINLQFGLSINPRNDNLLYHQMFDNNIYSINSSTIDTLIQFDLVGHNVTNLEEFGQDKDHIGIRRVIATDRTLSVIFNQKTGNYYWRIQNLGDNSSKTLANPYKIGLGDFYGFPIELPQWAYQNEYIYDYSALDFIEFIESIENVDMQRLEESIEGLHAALETSIEDNPLLVYLELR